MFDLTQSDNLPTPGVLLQQLQISLQCSRLLVPDMTKDGWLFVWDSLSSPSKTGGFYFIFLLPFFIRETRSGFAVRQSVVRNPEFSFLVLKTVGFLGGGLLVQCLKGLWFTESLVFFISGRPWLSGKRSGFCEVGGPILGPPGLYVDMSQDRMLNYNFNCTV